LNGRYALYCGKDASLGAHHKHLNADRPILKVAVAILDASVGFGLRSSQPASEPGSRLRSSWLVPNYTATARPILSAAKCRTMTLVSDNVNYL